MLVIPSFKLDCQRSSCDADLDGVVCVLTFPSGSNCVGGRCGNWMLVVAVMMCDCLHERSANQL